MTSQIRSSAALYRRCAVSLAAITLAVTYSPPAPDLQAQSASSAAPEMRFEVASIKPNTRTFEEHFFSSATGEQPFSGVRTMPGGRLHAKLGLKIEKTTGPVTFTIIDSIERPMPD